MKTSLIIFGVIFLVIGGLLYFVPMQEFKVGTTTIGNGDSDVRTSSANVTIPTEWAYASALIGLVLLVLGFVIPSSNAKNNPKRDSYDTVVESKENIEVGDGNKRKMVRERTEKHNAKKDEDED